MNDIFTRSISRILLITFFMLTGLGAFAQYTKTTLHSGGSYTAMTKDNAGNLYVVRFNSTTNKYEVVKFVNGTSTEQVIYDNLFNGSSLNIYSWGLAVNDQGDVFVTNPNQSVGWNIIKLTAPSYTSPGIIQSNRFFSALAVDNSNNLLSMEYNSSTKTYQLVRYPSGAEQLTGTVVWNGFTYPTAAIATTYPTNIVVDSHDNIYLTDLHEYSNGQIVKLTAPGFAATSLASGRYFSSLAIDGNDNFYTAEAGSDPNKYVLKKYTDLTATGTTLYPDLHQTTALFFPWGIAVMPDGTIFANDGENGGEIVKLTPPTINVTGITRQNSSPTNATNVTFRVTFSAAAANVTAGAFSLTTTGLTGTSITSVTAVPATNSFDVVVNTGTSTTGTVRLDVNGTGISPVVANAPYTSGPTYTIDRVVPVGTISINGGAAYINTTSAPLTLTGTDANPPLLMAFSTDGGTIYSANEAFATSKTLTLPTPDGVKTVHMRLTDAAGNYAVYSDNITLDTRAPVTTINSNPTNPSNTGVAAFAFSADEAGSTFEASRDGLPYSATTSPLTLTGLADGAHTFSVRAKDPAGNTGAPANYTWTIDATGPQITSVAVPTNGYYRAGQPLTFTVNYNEPAVVDQTLGTPFINIVIGTTTVQAPYTGGSGTNQLTFAYTVQQGEMDMDGITVQSTLDNNGGTIKDALGNNASTTLAGIGNTTLVRVNTSIPSVTLSFASGVTMPTNSQFTVVAVFSEAVIGLTVSDFNVLNTTVSNLATSDNITYTVLMTPASNGTRTISLPSGAALNIGGNPNTPSNTLTYTYDATAPTVTSVTVPSPKYYKAGENLSFTVNFSENVIVNTTGGSPVLTLTVGTATVNATYVSTTANAITFAYTVAPGDMDMDGITIGTLSLNGATIKDAATNNANLTLNSVPSTTNVRVNTSRPTTTITSSAPAIINTPFNATINFSESVTNFVPTDITVTNGTLQGFTQITGSTYLVQVAPTAEGTVTVQVPANVADNIGSNGNNASNILSRIYDIAPPAVTSVSVPVNGYYNAGTTLNFTVRFSENITLNTTGGNPTLNLTIGSAVKNATYTGLNGTDGLDFSYTVVDGDMDMDGIAVNDLTLNGATIVDIANNNAVITLNNVANTTGIFVNTQHPGVALSTTAPALVNAPFNVTVTFTEAVTGLAASDFTLTNATASNVAGSGTTYTVLVTPASDGPVSISLAADKAANIGDNGNTASNTLNFTYDGTVPTVTAVAVPVNDYYNAGSELNFIVRFSEDLVINTSGGSPTLTLNIGGTNVNATYTGQNGTDGLNFAYTVLDGQSDMDGIQITSLNLAGSTIKDNATNNANLTLNNVGNTSMVRVNTTRPSVTLSTPATPSVNTPFTVNIAFSENVTGFTSADISVTNGSSSPVTVIDNANYSVTIVPAGEGPVTINVPADKADNIGNNGNTASNTLTVNYDITAPAVASVAVPAPKYYRAGDVLNFSVAFNEDIVLNTTGGNPYLVLNIGANSVQANYTGVSTNRELNFSYTVVNGDQDMDGITVISLEASGSTIKDAATNNAVLTLNNIGNTSSVFVNTTSPTVTLTSTAPALVNAPFTVTATFSEAVTVLTVDEFTITNGTASNLQSNANTTYTVTVTPTADGPVTIQLPANKVVNIGGNANTPSNTLSFTYDGTAPAVTAVTVPVNGYYKAGDALNFTVLFNENIHLTGGTPSLDVILTTGTVKAAYTTATANSLSFRYTVQQGDMDLNGIALGTAISLNGSAIKDDATNNAILTLNNIANTTGVFVHTGSPSVQLSTAAASRVNAPFTVTAVFNEAVTGLTATDFNVTNGAVSNVQTADNITYTFTVTPAADGNVSVTLPATSAQNVVNNGNTASNTVTVLYDHTAPLITAGLAFEIPEKSAVGTQVGKVTAIETAGTLQNWTIATDDSNGAFAIDANGNITVADQAKLNSKVSTTVTLGITVSDGLNTSVAVPVTIKVTDATPPVVTAVTVPVNGYYKAGDALNFTVTFNENIHLTGGTPSLDVILTTGTVKAAYTTATANSLSFRYTVQQGDMDLNGIALGTAISLNGSAIKDDAANNAILTLNNIANTTGVYVHTGSPSVQLSTTAASRVNAPFTVTAVFNEAVTGLTATDFNVTNGAVSNVQTADNITYTFTVTPAADGAVSVTLPAASAQNVVNNGNTASNTVTVLYDHTAPLITAGLAFEILERSTVGTQVGKVTAIETAGTLQNWTITTDDSNGAFSIDANGNITVADQAKLNSKVNTTVTLGITVSDGLNTSVAVPVTVKVKMVNQAPTLDAIANATICPDGKEHTIQLSGAAAVEPGQTFGFSILTDKAASFDKLSVSAAGVITYQLKTTATGIQTVTVTIKDNGGTANGGIDSLRRSFNIEVATLGTVTITSDKGNTISKGDIIHLTATGGTHYEWDNAAGIISGQQTAVLEARPMQNTTYHVTVSNDLGCKNTADFAVTVVADFKVDAVNILTPNGDGRNDKWVIRNLDSYPNNEVKIFDRAGRLVYSRKNYSNDWDATINGAPLSTGTYYYILTIENGAKVAKGYITIVREQ
ncbi:gliding motility-associated C-terminal domain-containing protein [Chitinophaga jiangningensis]|uniref:Gliding motility-associated C-terminal domain-containing protein n=1 Tax=Chitinophaga jiangningensis TaxID=1419482 RepID=A0A1M7J079_9BACT|nr:Ig-like domain-containing protein [Chitinophaga jiangningensis]SHM46480.1 gliding motility-associated C-terminal domain-containing protein [Chitinophaga jiangningensis]